MNFEFIYVIIGHMAHKNKLQKHKDNMCQQDLHRNYLSIYKIKRKSKAKKKECTFAANSIKNARILGLLPFTHNKISY